MKFKTVLFDLDGTLLDTLEDLTDAGNYTLRQLGYPERTLREVRSFMGNGAERYLRLALGDGADEETVQRALDIYKPYYAAHCQIKTKPYDGVLDVMRVLKENGVKIGIVSNKPDEGVKLLAQQHFAGLVDVAMGETASRRRKPAPDMVEAALAALGMEKDGAVYIGDSEVDALTAKNSGVPLIAVCWGFRSRAQLVEAGATEIAATAEELIEKLK